MGTKADPGKYDCYAKAEPHEPYFVLLARDPYAPVLVRKWAERYLRLAREEDREQIAEAHQVADAMEDWRAARSGRKET